MCLAVAHQCLYCCSVSERDKDVQSWSPAGVHDWHNDWTACCWIIRVDQAAASAAHLLPWLCGTVDDTAASQLCQGIQHILVIASVIHVNQLSHFSQLTDSLRSLSILFWLSDGHFFALFAEHLNVFQPRTCRHIPSFCYWTWRACLYCIQFMTSRNLLVFITVLKRRMLI